MKIDVAIPCYRYGNFLRECVESVLSQQDVEAQILILDDASPDNTAEVGEELERLNRNVEFRRHAANKGHIATYNEGIEWASGDLFLLLSADDYLLPGALAKAARLMEATPSMSFVFGDALELFDDGSRTLCRPFGKMLSAETTILSCLDFLKSMRGRNIVPTPTAIVRTSAQKRVGGYCQDLPHAGDMAMWLRLAAEGEVGFLNSPQAVYRIHSQNMSRTYSSSRLPDVLQRRAAIEHFFNHADGLDQNLLHKILLDALGRDAMRQASAAFNDGEFSISSELSRVARDCYPGVRYTAPWIRHQINRAIGRRAWHALRSTYRRVGQLQADRV
ncbi:glycosyltransferase family 2 protein [Rhizobium sp. RAF56]|uniref:glycosyltransferase family 2 protein n=1 Tax=Rhizobium sp. RAF56 TaxID=3233062 RepID=UPI003F95CE79